MQLQAFSAKIQIQCLHLLHYTGSSNTSQVASSPGTLLAADQVTSFPSSQTEAPLPTPDTLGRRESHILAITAGLVGPRGCALEAEATLVGWRGDTLQPDRLGCEPQLCPSPAACLQASLSASP